MKRLTLPAALLLITTLAACTSTPTSPQTAKADEPVTISQRDCVEKTGSNVPRCGRQPGTSNVQSANQEAVDRMKPLPAPVGAPGGPR
ncbi:hypothetical protein IP84_12550 [beta proteobacterium AAP99]|nr:hypothetical protein IP84_12550 [beta proteobacterium AAP99]